MSIVRFGEEGSMVYLFETTVDDKPVVECCGCSLDEMSLSYTTVNAAADRYSAMLDHVYYHLGSGHIVPRGVLVELVKRGEENTRGG